ncbi:MAG: hypothetical protein L0215_06345 [Gemmataceae bacterium]|nr:hypothetical protein [Gemmataceae bacterium]
MTNDSSHILACPYCNAQFAAEKLERHSDKACCPRCGEPLPLGVDSRIMSATLHTAISRGDLRPVGTADISAPPETGTLEKPLSMPSSKTRAAANRRTLLVLLGIMTLLAAVGLTYALLTVDYRREKDYRPKKYTHEPVAVAPTGELAGLGYLPAGSNLVVAVNVQALRANPKTRALLEPPPPLLDVLLDKVEKHARLKIEEIDHVVLGAELCDKLPQIVVVARTRTPYNRKALADALKPAKATSHLDRPLFAFTTRPGEGYLWCADDRTLVWLWRLDAVTKEDLAALPLPPRQGEAAAPVPVQAVIGERVDKHSLVWAAGNLEDAVVLHEMLRLGGKDTLWKEIKAFSLSLLHQDDFALMAHCFTGNAKSTPLVRKQLEEWKMPLAKSVKVEAPPADVTEPAAQWVTLQLRGDVAAVRDALELFHIVPKFKLK